MGCEILDRRGKSLKLKAESIFYISLPETHYSQFTAHN